MPFRTFTRLFHGFGGRREIKVVTNCIAAVTAQELADALGEAVASAKCLSFVCSMNLGERGQKVRGETFHRSTTLQASAANGEDEGLNTWGSVQTSPTP
jgi:hypothetical protein